MKNPEFLNIIKTYFTFSKGERNGIILLIIFLALVITGIKLIPQSWSKSEPDNFNELKKQVDSLLILPDTTKQLARKPSSQTLAGPTNRLVERKRVLLNSSDSALLTQLPGIGPVLASRIIKYRNLLGGYYSLNQLREVYGLKDENFEKAKGLIIIEKDKIIRFSLDTADFRTLARHPYIGKEMAWKIINLRKKEGKNLIVKEYLTKGQLCDSAHWVKLEPYIILEKKSVSE